MQTYYQRTISFEWEIQVFRQLFHHLISAHIEFRHQGTFRRVIARMDDGAVCLGSTAADILLFLQHADLCLIPRQFPRRCRSGYTCSDYDHIIHLPFTPLHPVSFRSFPPYPTTLGIRRHPSLRKKSPPSKRIPLCGYPVRLSHLMP